MNKRNKKNKKPVGLTVSADKGAKKFLWGGGSAVMGEKPILKPYEFDGSKYDEIMH